MSSKNVETFRAAHQAFNARDFDAVIRGMTDDFVYEDRARGLRFSGPQAFKDFMQGWIDVFSDAEVTAPNYADAGDTVIAEFVGKGTNDGALGPLPKTGRQMNLPLCEIMQFNANGQIVGGRIYYDQQSILTQLGHAAAITA